MRVTLTSKISLANSNTRVCKAVLTSLCILMISGCATTQHSINEIEGRVVLADSHIGEHYKQVIKRAKTTYANEPHCEKRKVSLGMQRKAYAYEVCGFEPKSQLFLDAPLEEVVYHFIEGGLVRVDVRASGESELLDTVKADIAAVFGSSAAIQTTVGKDSYQWSAKQQVAGVRAGAGASTGNVHVRLLDESLVDRAPWLAAE